MIRERREEKNLTLLDVAKKINRSESYLSKLENHPNMCNPTIDIILKLSYELDLHRILVFEFFASAHDNNEHNYLY